MISARVEELGVVVIGTCWVVSRSTRRWLIVVRDGIDVLVVRWRNRGTTYLWSRDHDNAIG
jgi:hypothetical protein